VPLGRLCSHARAQLLLMSRYVVRRPTCRSHPAVGPSLNLNTASAASMAAPLVSRNSTPPLPTTAHVRWPGLWSSAGIQLLAPLVCRSYLPVGPRRRRSQLLGDAKSLLGDAKTSVGDAKSSLGDATSSLGDAKSSPGQLL
jgi:hypothetical protein